MHGVRQLATVRLLVAMALLAGGSATGCAAMQEEAPVSGQRCEGVPPATCASILRDATSQAPPGAGPVVGIEIRCAVESCTDAQGEARIVVTYANGTTMAWGQGWATPADTPIVPEGQVPEPTALPIVPVCIGVSQAWCQETAADMLANAPSSAAPVSVVVRCRGTCSPTSGEGTTVGRWADGSEASADWAYKEGGSAEP